MKTFLFAKNCFVILFVFCPPYYQETIHISLSGVENITSGVENITECIGRASKH